MDDQPTNIALLEEMLHQAGYRNVSTALDPREVFALHRRHDYDLILLDLQMPDMNGFQVIEALKSNKRDAYLPVLVVTAQPAHKLRALQAGAKDFISKPFDLIEARRGCATCSKSGCSTGAWNSTTANWKRPCACEPPNCARAKRAIAA